MCDLGLERHARDALQGSADMGTRGSKTTEGVQGGCGDRLGGAYEETALASAEMNCRPGPYSARTQHRSAHATPPQKAPDTPA
eukprot:1545355-Rhodomonas_salina.4